MKNIEFNSPEEWKEFCKYILHKNRYVLSKRWDSFIDAILVTSKKRMHILKKGIRLFRARIGSYEKEYYDENGNFNFDVGPLSPEEIEAPPYDKAQEGRINPKGIPYLYLANNIETAISEVRPWLKANVSVGHFILLNDLKLVDTSKDKHRYYVYFGKGKPKFSSTKKESYIWGDINQSFSIPVTPGDEHNTYVPTQYLSEYFKTHGWDGIIYKSSLNKNGYNIVLFNPQVAYLECAQLFDIEALKYEYKECANPYFRKQK
jgi:hypothetical protein